MLQRVLIEDLQLGMFIRKLEGNWFRHPFFRARFVLDDQAILAQLRSSRVKAVIIDTSRGAQPPAETRPAPSTVAPATGPASKPGAALQAARIARMKGRMVPEPSGAARAVVAKEAAASARLAVKAEKAVARVFIDARLGKAIAVRQVEPIVTAIYASIQRDSQAFNGLMRCKLNNEFVYRHAIAVSALMVSLARRMRLAPAQIREAGLAGLFLDFGTNFLPRESASASGDFRLAKSWPQHVALGHQSLSSQDIMPPSVLDACLQHHERLDGSGFPHGLAEGEITPLARMAALCDTFDFLLCDTQDGRGLDPAVAVARLKEMGPVFDQDMLRCFIESVGFYPVGSFVRLRSERLALVVDEDPDDPTRPVVQPFFSLGTGQRSWSGRLALANCYGEDAIVDVADLAGLDLPDPASLREQVFMRSVELRYKPQT